MPDAPKRMSPERLEELRTLPEVSGLPYYRMQEGRELIAEIDALRADHTALAAACALSLNQWLAARYGGRLMRRDTIIQELQTALARHGGGA